jgi:hypothetical protein
VSLDEYFPTTTTTVLGCHLDRVPLDVLKSNCIQHKYRKDKTPLGHVEWSLAARAVLCNLKVIFWFVEVKYQYRVK